MKQENPTKRTVQAKEGVNFTIPVRLLRDVISAINEIKHRSEGIVTLSDVCAAGFVAFLSASKDTQIEWIGRARTYDLRNAPLKILNRPPLADAVLAAEAVEDADAEDQDDGKATKRTNRKTKGA